MIKKIINYILKKYCETDWIEKKMEENRINKSINSTINSYKSRFYPEANVENLQKNNSKITIGEDTHIRGELLIYPSGGEIKIGNFCYVGENTRIWSKNKIIIKNNVLISHNVNIHDTNSHPINYKERENDYKKIISTGHSLNNDDIVISSPILIEENVWIGFNAIILKGVTIGRGSIVAAGSVVTKDIPPFSIVAGSPARIIKRMSEI
jgi:acetyltransferase-like isoleucine patch superfamily enzyme